MISGQMLSRSPRFRSTRNSGPTIASTGKKPATRMNARIAPAPRIGMRASA